MKTENLTLKEIEEIIERGDIAEWNCSMGLLQYGYEDFQKPEFSKVLSFHSAISNEWKLVKKNMKIICKDNFDRDYKDETLVCENVNKYFGEKIVDFLNDTLSGDDSPNFYVLVDSSHKLYKFEP